MMQQVTFSSFSFPFPRGSAAYRAAAYRFTRFYRYLPQKEVARCVNRPIEGKLSPTYLSPVARGFLSSAVSCDRSETARIEIRRLRSTFYFARSKRVREIIPATRFWVTFLVYGAGHVPRFPQQFINRAAWKNNRPLQQPRGK